MNSTASTLRPEQRILWIVHKRITQKNLLFPSSSAVCEMIHFQLYFSCPLFCKFCPSFFYIHKIAFCLSVSICDCPFTCFCLTVQKPSIRYNHAGFIPFQRRSCSLHSYGICVSGQLVPDLSRSLFEGSKYPRRFKITVKVTLPLRVRQSFRLGVKPFLGLTTSYVMVRPSGAPSLTTLLVVPLEVIFIVIFYSCAYFHIYTFPVSIYRGWPQCLVTHAEMEAAQNFVFFCSLAE